MQTESIVEVAVNIKTQKLFILLDDLGGRLKLINPSGEIMDLPDSLFEEEIGTIESHEFQQKLTPAQMEKLNVFNNEMAAQADRAAQADQKILEKPELSQERKPKKKREKKDLIVKKGAPVSWNASRLTFFRHKIEPMNQKQSFLINVNGTVYEITKEQFHSEFNDVVMSMSYRQDGLFSYPEVPEKALKFIKS